MRRSTFARVIASTLTVTTALPARAADDSVSVLYAGSLVTLMERTIGPAFTKATHVEFAGEAKGSIALANAIRDGIRTPDVFISADPLAIAPLVAAGKARWYASFATARLQIGYSPRSPFAERFAALARGNGDIVGLLAEPALRIGRTDPTLDPKGYRTILAVQLLGQMRASPNLASQILGDEQNARQILPEETLLVRLEAGEIDCAFLYSTETAARGIAHVELPARANLGDPTFATTYASARVTSGATVHIGAPITYAITILEAAPHRDRAARFARFFLTSEALVAGGMSPIAPVVSGDRTAIPSELRTLLYSK